MERRARPSTVIGHHSTICMTLTLTTLWCFNTMIKAHSSAVRALRCYLINNPTAKKYHHSSSWAPSRFWVVHQQISFSTIMPLAHLLPKYIHLESNLSLKSLNLGQSFEKFRETVGISVGWTSVDGIREATEDPDESPQCYLWLWEEMPEKPIYPLWN